jgi:ribosomal protein S18 acetylase RimI-like enzyme
MQTPAKDGAAGETRIRRAMPDDAALVRSIVRESFFDLYRDRDHPVPRPTTVDFAPLIARDEVWLIEAATETGFAPVGAMVLEEHPGYLRLDIVAIRPAHQHRGHGRAAMIFIEAHAVSNGFGEIRFYTNTAIERNVAFYRRLGYIETAHWRSAKRPNETYVDFVKVVRTGGGRPETALDPKSPRAT